jgi:hypothetical protein
VGSAHKTTINRTIAVGWAVPTSQTQTEKQLQLFRLEASAPSSAKADASRTAVAIDDRFGMIRFDRLRDSLGNFNIRSLVLRFDRWKAKSRRNSSFRPFKIDYDRRSTWDDSIRPPKTARELRLILRFDRSKMAI